MASTGYATAKADGNHEVDLLLCVPPTWVSYTANGKVSKVAEKYREWGKKVWDGVDLDVRSTFPTSLDEYRVVQYESCRGLEGWVVVNFGFDEFYDYKLSNAEIDRSELNLFYKEEEATIDYAKRWLMIPLTRAIDTLVIHISDKNSYIGKVLQDLRKKFPDDVKWEEFH